MTFFTASVRQIVRQPRNIVLAFMLALTLAGGAAAYQSTHNNHHEIADHKASWST